MKLGEKVRFKKALVAVPSSYESWDIEETKKFAKENNITVFEDSSYYKGVIVKSRWKVRTYDNVQEGIICGVRNIDLNGSFDYEYGYSFGNSKKVYLVAKDLRGLLRIPEEFILEEGES